MKDDRKQGARPSAKGKGTKRTREENRGGENELARVMPMDQLPIMNLITVF